MEKGKTMTDYIKREDAKKWLTNLREDCGRYQDLWHYAEALNQIIESLDADVVPVRHGRWVTTYQYSFPIWECSECGAQIGTANFAFCPCCGAKMDEEVEE